MLIVFLYWHPVNTGIKEAQSLLYNGKTQAKMLISAAQETLAPQAKQTLFVFTVQKKQQCTHSKLLSLPWDTSTIF